MYFEIFPEFDLEVIFQINGLTCNNSSWAKGDGYAV